MDELTAYFLTTDRVHAEEALASLNAQGIPRPVVVVRNVRPLYAAHLPTLKCETPYCLVLDDDTVLLPGVAQRLVAQFQRMREVQPSGYRLSARIYVEVNQVLGTGGLKLFYTPHLRRVGWPNEPHVTVAQAWIARQLGFLALDCDTAAGIQRRGTDLDVYKKYLWIGFRAQAGQHGGGSLAALVARARQGPAWLWFGVLGLADAQLAGAMSTSKDEDYLGPIGRTLDFAKLRAAEIPQILARHGIATDGKMPATSRPSPG